MGTAIYSQLAELLILLFLIVTYAFSFFEKVFDWKNTIGYIEKNFEKTVIKNYIKPLIAFLVFIEAIALFFLIIGLFDLIFYNKTRFAIIGISIVASSIIYMLIGQRIAKDYPGATSLVSYFLLTVFCLYLLQ